MEVTAASTAANPLGQGTGTYMSNDTKWAISRTTAGTVFQNGSLYVANNAEVTLGVANAGVTNRLELYGYTEGYGQGVTIIKEGEGVLRLNRNDGDLSNWGLTAANKWLVKGGLISANADASYGNSNNKIALDGGGLLLTSNLDKTYRTIELSNNAANSIQNTNSATAYLLSAKLTGDGGFAKIGAGTITLANTNTHTGTTTVGEGVLVLSNGSAIGDTRTVALSNIAGATLAVATSETIGSLQGGGTTGGNVSIVGGRTLTVAETGSQTYAGVISNSGALVKSGAGTLTLSGANTYTGATTVSEGKLVVSGSIASSATVVTNAGTLGGSGTVGTLTIADGGTLAPGNSPGTIFASSTTWADGGSYDWEILNLDGPAGDPNGWDLLDVDGTLSLTGLTSSNFTINLITLSDSTTRGALSGFDPSATYTNWVIARAGTITGFDPSLFNLYTNSFVATAAITGSFGITNGTYDGDQAIFLTYTGGGAPIPEPGTWAAALLLAATAGFVSWRRKRKFFLKTHALTAIQV